MGNYQSINPELVGLALDNLSKFAKEEKRAFVPAGDPAMMGGDPAMMGGDPAMMGGPPPPGGPPMDPAMGGAPPMDPAMGGGPPMDPMAAIQPMIEQAVQAAMASQGGGMGGGVGSEGQIKPKIDVNIEIMQMKKILAKISDALGIQIPAADMVATPEDLTAMAQGGSAGAGAMAGEGGAPPSAIQPIEPIGAAMPGPAKMGAWENGRAEDVLQEVVNDHQSTADKAAALWQMMSAGG
jgi:hypothetical protein